MTRHYPISRATRGKCGNNDSPAYCSIYVFDTTPQAAAAKEAAPKLARPGDAEVADNAMAPVAPNQTSSSSSP
eukprot:2405668-Heterocapsa_arctica.AAC.1